MSTSTSTRNDMSSAFTAVVLYVAVLRSKSRGVAYAGLPADYGRGVAGVIEFTFQAVIDWCQMSSCRATRCSGRLSSAGLIDNSCAVCIPFDDSYLRMSLFRTRSKVIECTFLKYESSNGMCVHWLVPDVELPRSSVQRPPVKCRFDW